MSTHWRKRWEREPLLLSSKDRLERFYPLYAAFFVELDSVDRIIIFHDYDAAHRPDQVAGFIGWDSGGEVQNRRIYLRRKWIEYTQPLLKEMDSLLLEKAFLQAFVDVYTPTLKCSTVQKRSLRLAGLIDESDPRMLLWPIWWGPRSTIALNFFHAWGSFLREMKVQCKAMAPWRLLRRAQPSS